MTPAGATSERPEADPPARGGAAPSPERLQRMVAAQRALACAPADPAEILTILARSAWAVLGAEGALTAQGDGDLVVAQATVGFTPVRVGTAIPLLGTVAGLALLTQQSQLTRDGFTDTRSDPVRSLGMDTRSSITVPLVYEGHSVGLVAVTSSRPDAFDRRDLGHLEMLADVGAHRLAFALSRDAGKALRALSSAALRESEARLSVAQQLTGLASWALDVPAGRLEWSEQMFRLVGLDPAGDPPDLEGFYARVHPDDRDDCRRLWASDQPSDEGRREVFRVVHADGSVRYLQAWSQVERGDDGQLTKVTGATLDITDRELAARELAASEQHFRIAFDNAPIGMSMISLRPDTLGQYLRSNDAFCRMLGYRHEEISSMDVSALTHPGDLERDLTRFGSIARGEASSADFEKRFRHKDGHVVFAWVTAAVARDPTGAPMYLISHAVDISDRRKEQAELQRLALTDTLTGLANRTLLSDRLDQALARLHREDSFAALMLLDVDRFKLVNDSFGHQVGDAMLVQMAGRIEAVSRAESTVARLGGDEFVVLVEGLVSADDVHGVATRLLDALRRPYSIPGTGATLVATVSIGVAVVTTADRSPVDIHREADLALYRAKDAGRDQYALFDDVLRARVVERMDAESLLRRALADDLLLPHYQPILDMVEGRLLQVESLARIDDPVRGLITPDRFIEVAEETGLIVELDGRMIELAIGQLARWRRAGVQLRRMSVNVSARSLEDEEFVERIARAAKWYDVAGGEIRIELTERSLLTTSPIVRASLDRLNELGFPLGLDDFGTGYSALAYLQRFPLAFLKIDRSFVARLGHSRRDDAVVAAVIDLAHAHDALVVAEGVETHEQLAALRTMGCDRAQGYLLGRPLPPAELEALLATDPRW